MDYESAQSYRHKCKYCDYEGRAAVVEGPFSGHWGKLVCYNCEAYIDWIAKPDREKSKRPANHRQLVHKHGQGFCELCLVKEAALPAGEFFEAHHVIEYADTQNSSRENIWILCRACHRFVHWRRKYLGLPQEESGDAA